MLSHQKNDTHPVSSTLASKVLGPKEAREQVDRILASDTLRSSEAVRRLFKFLAEKTFSGQADELKEYSVAVDALGKPPSYDPRKDAGVRLVASRLRLKLDEYYRKEGTADPLAIEVPRGRFKIIWKPNGTTGNAITPGPTLAPPIHSPAAPPAPVVSPDLNKWRLLAFALAALSLILATVEVITLIRPGLAPVAQPMSRSTPGLDALWNPFLSSHNHIVIAFWNPVFVRFQRPGARDIWYRENGTEWKETTGSRDFAEVKQLLGNPTAKPSLNFTMRGSLVSIFALSQFLSSRRSDVSLTRLDELSWQQVADNNLILIAPRQQVHERQSALPVSSAFVADQAGIHNLNPRNGEPTLYEDLQDPQQSDGEAVELVSVLPGPLGRTRVVSFAGNHAPGLIGSVQAMTDDAFARGLVKRLRDSSGKLPTYFQIVIKVKYRDDTPTSTSYLTHRALTLDAP